MQVLEKEVTAEHTKKDPLEKKVVAALYSQMLLSLWCVVDWKQFSLGFE